MHFLAFEVVSADPADLPIANCRLDQTEYGRKGAWVVFRPVALPQPEVVVAELSDARLRRLRQSPAARYFDQVPKLFFSISLR